MATLVVDASVAIKWQVREPYNDEARLLLANDEELIAPDWLLVEAASTFWKKVKSSELLQVHAERHLEELPEYFHELRPCSDILPEALRWSIRLHHSVYDCLYLALADRAKASLITADKKFFAKVSASGAFEAIRFLPEERK